MKPKTIRRPKAKMEDLTSKDLRLLTLAYGLPDDQFMCFGKSYFPLQSLGLISDECQITYMGRRFIWEQSQEIKKKKVENDNSTAH